MLEITSIQGVREEEKPMNETGIVRKIQGEQGE